MSEFFKSSAVWVVDFRYDGRDRRWFRTLRAGLDPQAQFSDMLADLYGKRARLISVHAANHDEELLYVRGLQPRNQLCPTGRGPVGEGK